MIYFNRKIRFRELFNQIHQAASSLKALGIGKGDIVTLQVLNMPQTVVLFYAISYIGAVANIIYITAGEKELHDILCNTESKMYITIDSLWLKQKGAIENTRIQNVLLLRAGQEADVITKTVLNIRGKAVKNPECLSWKSFLARGKETPQEVNAPDLPVAMVYTSGTTGKAKAVVLSNKCMNSLVLQYSYTHVSLKRGGAFMNSLPPFIAFGIVFAMHMPLCLGITDILILDPTSMNAGKYFAKYKPNYFVNGQVGIESIMKYPKIQKMNLEFIDVLAAGGQALSISFEDSVNTFLREHQSDVTLSIGYGMTEVAATVVTSTPKVSRMGTVGIPLPGTIIKIVEPGTTKELSYNTDGEICFNAPTMMLGYYKQEEETKNIIRLHEDGLKWVHSGDIGRISDDGFLTVVGRIKRIVDIRENGIYHKVFPKLIEDEIEITEGISAVAIVGRRKPIIENELIAFIVKEANSNEEQIIQMAKKLATEKLESWERPVEYRFIEELPRTTVGKVDYRKLEQVVNE